MKKLTTITAITLLLIFAQSTFAQHYRMQNRTQLEFSFIARDYKEKLFNYYDPVNDIYFSSNKSFEDGKFSVSLNHFNTEQSAVTFSIGASEVSNDYFDTGYDFLNITSSIVPIFVGARFYLADNRGYSPIKPYVAVSAGPVLGINNYKFIGDNIYIEDDVYATLGAYLGGGVDLMVAKNFTLGMNAGYNFYGDFDEYVGDRENYSGAEIGISFGILFGGDHYEERQSPRKKRVRKF